MRALNRFLSACVVVVLSAAASAQDLARELRAADPVNYLESVCKLLRVDWPQNRTVNIVCHGHSVPAGYFKTPEVRTLESYPHRLHVGLAKRFPHAVINVVVTAIGGENSEQGAARFEKDVLTHRPDVVTIDYGLNDRRLGLERARKSWVTMIELAKAKGIKVLLLTPTPDLSAKLDDENDPLNQHAKQIRELAREHGTGLVDSLAAFQTFAKSDGDISTLMSQRNHPNEKGHELVARALLKWFP